MEYRIEIRRIRDLLDDKKYLTNINMQRKYIYSHEQAKFLLDSIQKKIPIPAIYLWDNCNDTYDVIDGKQRITVMRLYNNPNYFPGLHYNFFIDHMETAEFENYEVPVIVCKGVYEEKIATFKRINTTAVALKEFEIYNALYQGSFVEELGNWGATLSPIEELFFGKSMRGENCIKALKLYTENVEDYIRHNRNQSFVNGLKGKIDTLLNITLKIFGDYKTDYYILAKIVLENIGNEPLIKSWVLNKEKIISLFNLYNNNGELKIAPSKESFYKEILNCYNCTGLDSRRFFTPETKQNLYINLKNGFTKGKKICPCCNKEFSFNEFEIDHIIPWSRGGKTSNNNAQLLCKSCNSSKSNK